MKLFHHHCHRRWVIKTVSVEHTSKHSMVVVTVIIAVIGAMLSMYLPGAAAAGVLVATTTIVVAQWAKWQSKNH